MWVLVSLIGSCWIKDSWFKPCLHKKNKPIVLAWWWTPYDKSNYHKVDAIDLNFILSVKKEKKKKKIKVWKLLSSEGGKLHGAYYKSNCACPPCMPKYCYCLNRGEIKSPHALLYLDVKLLLIKFLLKKKKKKVKGNIRKNKV